jgi:hypothetical protein
MPMVAARSTGASSPTILKPVAFCLHPRPGARCRPPPSVGHLQLSSTCWPPPVEVLPRAVVEIPPPSLARIPAVGPRGQGWEFPGGAVGAAGERVFPAPVVRLRLPLSARIPAVPP